ncbi:MAG: tetratricopeptide repeat protein [bacterium]|nr:tetratricopeptide repeat protein [bacterium]
MSHVGLSTGTLNRTILEGARIRNPDNLEIAILADVASLIDMPLAEFPEVESSLRRLVDRSENPEQFGRIAAIALKNLSVFFIGENDLSKAEKICLAALSFYPNYPIALFDLGEIYRVQGKNNLAIETFQKLLELQPTDREGLSRLAALLSRAGRHGEAVGLFLRAIEADPDNPDLYYGLGQTLISLGALEQSIPVYQLVIELNPNDERPLLSLAEVYERLGNTGKAFETYLQVLQRNPDHKLAKMKRAHLWPVLHP